MTAIEPQSPQAQAQQAQAQPGCLLGLTPIELREEAVTGNESPQAIATESWKKLVANLNENNCETSIEQRVDITLPESPILSSDDGKMVPVSVDGDVIP